MLQGNQQIPEDLWWDLVEKMEKEHADRQGVEGEYGCTRRTVQVDGIPGGVPLQELVDQVRRYPGLDGINILYHVDSRKQPENGGIYCEGRAYFRWCEEFRTSAYQCIQELHGLKFGGSNVSFN